MNNIKKLDTSLSLVEYTEKDCFDFVGVYTKLMWNSNSPCVYWFCQRLDYFEADDFAIDRPFTRWLYILVEKDNLKDLHEGKKTFNEFFMGSGNCFLVDVGDDFDVIDINEVLDKEHLYSSYLYDFGNLSINGENLTKHGKMFFDNLVVSHTNIDSFDFLELLELSEQCEEVSLYNVKEIKNVELLFKMYNLKKLVVYNCGDVLDTDIINCFVTSKRYKNLKHFEYAVKDDETAFNWKHKIHILVMKN